MDERGEDAAEPPYGDDLAGAFGGNVRRRREEAGLTLERLSARSAVSRAMLSKVERGEKSPTIGVASRIAHALDVPLSDLLGAPGPASTAAVVLRRRERPVFRDPETGFERHSVSPAPGTGGPELIVHRLPAGVSLGLLPAYAPDAEKQLLVLEGTLTAAIGGVTETLEEGDTMFLRADTEHGFANRGAVPCEYLMVIWRRG